MEWSCSVEQEQVGNEIGAISFGGVGGAGGGPEGEGNMWRVAGSYFRRAANRRSAPLTFFEKVINISLINDLSGEQGSTINHSVNFNVLLIRGYNSNR